MKNLKYRSKSRPHQPTRQVKEVILIVHEGKSTEYNYFSGIKKEGRLSSLILKGPYPDPKTLILETIKLLQKDTFNRAYCVFDHDGRKSFQIALDLIRRHNKQHSVKIEPITSNPCFEIWPLLHYKFSTKSYHAHSSGISASDTLTKELCKHLPKYRKNLPTLYQELKEKTPQAIKHAEKLSVHQGHDCTKNPFTNIHKLVKTLLLLPHH
ncbi:MAG: RloB family protein [Rhabdochlamydiaceae bacterium]|jgi:hypothetical protein